MRTFYSNKATRKALAFLLMLALVVTYSVPITAFAGVNNNTATVVSSGGEKTVEDGAVKVSKTIKGTNNDNEFEITLKVETKDKIVTAPATNVGADIVLVLDTSGSMDDNSRMSKATKAANDFAKKVLGNGNPAGNRVALVTFGDNANKIKFGNYYNRYYFTDSISSIEDKLIGISAKREGTNIQAGIKAAQDLLKDSTKTKYIVLLSDGAPTYSYEATGNTNNAQKHGGEIFDDDYLPYLSYSQNSDWYKIDSKAKEYKITKFYNNEILGDGTSYYNNDYAYNNNNERIYISNHGLPTISQAILAKKSGINIFTVGCELADGANGTPTKENAVSVLKNCANNADCYFDVSNASDLSINFETIAEHIILQTKAWTVTDPMGEKLDIVGSVNENGATNNGNTITWDLKSIAAKPVEETVNGAKHYVYTLKYIVKLDVTDPDFVEGTEYDTNGTTTLTYTIGEPGTSSFKDGSVEFPIPSVSGEVPEVNYSIEYYKWNKKAKDYPDDPEETSVPKTAKLHTKVSVGAIDAVYKTKYDNYYFESGTTELTLGSLNEEENVLKLFYKPIPASVEVVHNYKLTTINENNERVTTTAQAIREFTEGLYKGDSFTATTEAAYNGITYAYKSSDGEKITLDNENTINLYYEGEIDERAVANYEVKRQYETGTYELNEDGRYEKVYKNNGDAGIFSSGTSKAYESVITSTTDKVTNGYTYNRFVEPTKAVYNGTDNTITMPLSAGENNLLVIFRAEGTDNRQPADVKVVHHYKLTETTIINDAPVTTTREFEVETPMTGFYVNEKFTPVEVKEYNGDTYNSDSGNAARCTLTAININKVQVDLDYNLTKTPKKAGITVIHNYDEEIKTSTTNGSIQTEHIKTSTSAIFPEIGSSDVLYAGQVFTADTSAGGFTFVRGDGEGSGVLEGMQKTLESGDDNVLNLYYKKTTDNRGVADIIVRHTYITHVETIVDGKVQEVIVKDEAAFSEKYERKAGDEYTVTAKTSPNPIPTNSAVYGNGEFKLTTDSEGKVGTITLPEGTTTIELVYERNATDLKTTALKVIYKYINKIMTIIEGVAGYNEEETDGTVVLTGTAIKVNNGESLPEGVYVGEKYTIDGNNVYGEKSYTETSGAHDVELKEGGEEANTSIFVYERTTPLPTTTVTVNQHYELISISAIGVPTTTTSEALGTPFDKYVGENAVAKAQAGDSNFVRVDVTGTDNYDVNSTNHDVNLVVSNSAVTVDYYFTKTNDLSIKATGVVVHHYQDKDYDGSRTEVTSHAAVINSFATLTYTADKHENSGYTFEKAVTSQSIELVEGDGNRIDMYYVKDVDTRENTEVTVIHNYYKHDTSGLVPDTTSLPGILKGSKTETVTGFDNKVWVGNKYTATLQKTFGEGTDATNYEFLNSTPDKYTIESLSKDGNTITINYIYNYDASVNVEVTINHIYKTYDNYTGETTSDTTVVNAKYGDSNGMWNKESHTFTANEVQRDGFTRTTSDDEMTIVYSTGSNEMDVEYLLETDTRPSPRRPSNPPETEEINEEEVPLTEVPVTENPAAEEPIIIEEEEVPLADLPATGGIGIGLFLLAGVATIGAGIARRRKED